METQNLSDIWTKVLSVLQTEISPANFFTLFKDTGLLSLEKDPTKETNSYVATIAAPSTMIIDLIKKRFSPIIKTTLQKHTGGNIEIILVAKTIAPLKKIEDKEPLFVSDIFKEEKKHPPPASVAPTLLRVRLDYTFENLAVSGSNQLAFVASKTVAKNPGTTYNPLFIYGPVGVGKTHLMHAIANEVFKKNPDKKIIYKTSEEFTNEVVEAIRGNQTHAMKKKFRAAQVFIVDDIQFIAGKDRVQEELFHTFNILIDENCQIILSSDRPPHEIKKLEKRLSSRFAGGLTVDIETPDFELRCAILLIKAKKYGLALDMKTAQSIAQHIDDTRLLEGALLRLITEASTSGKSITDIAQKKDFLNKSEREKKHFHPDDVVKNVCLFYNIKPTQLKGPKREAFLVKARQICMYLLKKELGLPYVEIGNVLGGRDHTTIMYGVEKVENLLSLGKMKDEILGISRALRG